MRISTHIDWPSVGDAAIRILLLTAAFVTALVHAGSSSTLILLACTAALCVSGLAAKLGDDLIDTSRNKPAGGLLIVVSVMLLLVACAVSTDMYWMIGGGLLGVLLHGKIDNRALAIAVGTFFVCWIVWGFTRRTLLRVDLFIASACALWLDEHFSDSAENDKQALSAALTFCRWLGQSRYILTVVTTILFASGGISAGSWCFVMAFECGYALAEAMSPSHG